MPLTYKGQLLDRKFRPDLIVEDTLLVEVKSVQSVLPIHEAQLHSYLKLSGLKAGILMNFNTVRLVDGLRRRLL